MQIFDGTAYGAKLEVYVTFIPKFNILSYNVQHKYLLIYVPRIQISAKRKLSHKQLISILIFFKTQTILIF